ncbi:MAG TPA: O-antigen ligase family protein [Solirubrobacteraceae bacterium]|jgi:O-antigen ligase|nr:O-antigen ligase family protein [Solirubrobacteraceae bacterium]
MLTMDPPSEDRPAPGTAARLIGALREAPVTVPALAALVLMVVWASSDAGYPLTHWAPGALIVLALLAIALLAVRPRVAEIPLAVRIALLCLAAYTALSFLSILWAGVPGDAWEGANRTLLYLLVFALFACWPQRGASAALLLCAWTLALVALAAHVALHVDAAAGSASQLAALLPEGRLVYPAGYVNANAAQWLMAFWPALLLARARRLPWALRGALAGGAVLLAEVALLSQSRGSLYSTAVLLVLVFALLPARVRTFAVLVPVAAGIAAAGPAVLRVAERVEAGRGAVAAIHSATLAMFAAALAVALVVAAAAAIECRRGPLPRAAATRVHRGVGALAIAALIVVLAGGWIAAGNPITRARHAWDTFKSPSGYAANSHTGSRLTAGFGSNRYDFYRVALDEFAAHPLLGIGADNFAEPYLAHGRSTETPHYPHSVELRTLTETGLLGALLALAGLGAALLACWHALARSPDRLARAVAAAALAGFGYWAVHGSFDWFWEFAGLGAPAFALLGLACALAPRRARQPHGADLEPRSAAALPVGGTGSASRGDGPRRDGPRLGRARPALALGGALLALVAIVSLTAPWLSALQAQSAARIWLREPATAYARLNDAARLNPLSDEPYVLAGSIALRLGELARADHDFALALQRTPGDAYATLERGAIASTRGQRRGALALLERAARLDPRDPITAGALALARRGQRVDVDALNRSILANARQFS